MSIIYFSIYLVASEDDPKNPLSQMPKGLPDGLPADGLPANGLPANGLPSPDMQSVMSAAEKPTLYLGAFQILAMPVGAAGLPPGFMPGANGLPAFGGGMPSISPPAKT